MMKDLVTHSPCRFDPFILLYRLLTDFHSLPLCVLGKSSLDWETVSGLGSSSSSSLSLALSQRTPSSSRRTRMSSSTGRMPFSVSSLRLRGVLCRQKAQIIRDPDSGSSLRHPARVSRQVSQKLCLQSSCRGQRRPASNSRKQIPHSSSDSIVISVVSLLLYC